MDHCTIYFSSSTIPFQDADLAGILEQSRRDNAKAGISGVLLYVRESIVQVLEGEKEAVDELYSRIERDQRHKKVTRVLNRPIQERLFSDWSMGYETLTSRQLDSIQTIINFKEPEIDQPVILKMIKLFYEGNRHN